MASSKDFDLNKAILKSDFTRDLDGLGGFPFVVFLLEDGKVKSEGYPFEHLDDLLDRIMVWTHKRAVGTLPVIRLVAAQVKNG